MITQQFITLKGEVKYDLTPPDINKDYCYSPTDKCKKFTLLMKCVLLYKEYSNLFNSLSPNYIKENINIQNEDGCTALMISCINLLSCSEDIIKILIEYGANVNIKNKYGCHALMIACRNSNTISSENIVKILIDAGADLNIQADNGCTSLMMACRYSNIDSTENTVKMLIDAGADLNVQVVDGITSLMMSCCSKDSSINTVKMLIDKGADLNVQTMEGCTALTMSIFYDYKDKIKILIEAGESYINLDKLSIESIIILLNIQRDIILEKQKQLDERELYIKCKRAGFNVVEATILSYI